MIPFTAGTATALSPWPDAPAVNKPAEGWTMVAAIAQLLPSLARVTVAQPKIEDAADKIDLARCDYNFSVTAPLLFIHRFVESAHPRVLNTAKARLPAIW